MLYYIALYYIILNYIPDPVMLKEFVVGRPDFRTFSSHDFKSQGLKSQYHCLFTP